MSQYLKPSPSYDDLTISGSTTAPSYSTVDNTTLHGQPTRGEKEVTPIPTQLYNSSETLILSMRPDNCVDTTFTDVNGHQLYSVSEERLHFGTTKAVKRVTLFDAYGLERAHWDIPATVATEVVVIDGVESRRSSWLSSGLPLTSTKGKFTHEGTKYRWKASTFKLVKASQKVHVLTLYGKDENIPAARFTASHRDWSAPNADNELVVTPARLEIFEEVLSIVPIVVFSLLVAEKLRRDSNPESLSYDQALGRGSPMANLIF